jgi:hypothetical protein
METTNITYVTLETENGTITLELLHAVETQLDIYIVEVKGTSYDIFATPSNSLKVHLGDMV